MRGLAPYAWRSLVARPARSLLTISGIAIGVAVLVAAIAVNAGLDAAVDRTVASLIGRADIRLEAFTEVGLSSATLDAVDGVPGVAVAAPAIERRSFFAPVTGKPIGTDPVTILGIDPAKERHVRDLGLVRGAPLSELDEAAALITERLAREEGLDLASEITLLGAGAPLHARVVGILAGDGPAIGSGGRTIIMPIGTVQTMGRADGEAAPADGKLAGVTRIDIVLAEGAGPDVVEAGIGQALTVEPYILSAPRDIAATLRASTADIRGTLALLASITLFAAAFLILNTLSMTVVERIRELGLLRANGATRGQVIRVVVIQALVLGVAGSVVGVLGGALLAAVAAAWLRAAGNINLDRPELVPGAVIAGVAAGVLVTLVAAMEPARRAASVSPVIALRARSNPALAARAHTGWVVVVMAVVGFAAVLLLPVGAGAPLGSLRAVVIYAALIVAVLVTPLLLGPLSRLAGLPFASLLRLEERLARAAIARDRNRTALTIGALVVGLAMVVAMGSVQVNARVTATAWLTEVVPGDEVLTAIAPAPIGVGGIDEHLVAIPGVQSATPVASFDLAFKGTRLEATAIRGSDFLADGRLVFTSGDRQSALAAIDRGGAVVLQKDRAARMGVGLEDVIAVATSGGLVELRVAGIVARSFPGRSGETALVGWSDAERR
ncbi:MAG: ABC transporter permease, partial [Chloroflexota bacterium]